MSGLNDFECILKCIQFFNFTFGSARLRSQWIPRSRVHAAFESSRLRRFTFEAHVRQQHDAGSVPHLDSVIKDISIYIYIYISQSLRSSVVQVLQRSIHVVLAF